MRLNKLSFCVDPFALSASKRGHLLFLLKKILGKSSGADWNAPRYLQSVTRLTFFCNQSLLNNYPGDFFKFGMQDQCQLQLL